MPLNPESSHIAIILFTRSFHQEAQCKTFVPNVKANEAVAKSLIDHAENEVLKTGYRVFRYTEKHQRGHTFGERFSNAFCEVFTLGYEKVIAIGNDCPALDCELIIEAGRRLMTQSVVVGPTADGGVYLLGLTSNGFDQDWLKNLPWQTSRLYETISKHTEKRLPLLKDINDYTMLKAALKVNGLQGTGRQNIVFRVIKNILFIHLKAIKIHFYFKIPHFGVATTFRLRPPPYRSLVMVK